jgi:predicted lactoylglutathione lyase
MVVMDGLAQVNLVVTDLVRAKEFWALIGYESTPRHRHAAVLSFPTG